VCVCVEPLLSLSLSLPLPNPITTTNPLCFQVLLSRVEHISGGFGYGPVFQDKEEQRRSGSNS
jgi:hypothetical protein